jgi:hypothetical protein
METYLSLTEIHLKYNFEKYERTTTEHNKKIWSTSGLRLIGKMIGKGNIHNTKNLPASGRLRAIFAEQ